MPTKTFERVAKLRERYADQDPASRLIRDARAEIAEARGAGASDFEVQQLRDFAYERAAELGGDEAVDKALFALSDDSPASPTSTPEPEKFSIFDEATRQTITVDSVSAENENFARVVASIRGAGTQAEARAFLDAALDAEAFTEDEGLLLDSVFRLETLEDGTYVPRTSATTHDEALAEAQAEIEAAKPEQSPLSAMLERMVAEAEAAESSEVSSDAAA